MWIGRDASTITTDHATTPLIPLKSSLGIYIYFLIMAISVVGSTEED